MEKRPLEFLVPQHLLYTKEEKIGIPIEQELQFNIGTAYLTTWGKLRENYILQQVYAISGATLVFLSVKIISYTKLKAKCAKGVNAFQYTLQGFSFARLNGYGCLPLFENTYTLQYIPEGDHEVLFAPGEYHFFYFIPGAMLETLAANQRGIVSLIKSMQDGSATGKLEKRFPIFRKTKEVIIEILNTSVKSRHFQLTINEKLLELLKIYQEQVFEMNSQSKPEDYYALINSLVANHIQLSVSDIIRKLRSYMYLETATLRNLWVKNVQNVNVEAPRQSFKTLRLIKGLYHLAVENLPVKETAAILNFQDVSAFSKQFRNYFNISPTQAQLLFYL